ncbi:hypothetical protein CPB83DRAFT_850263 [Crepidotus variabilis]|uniref:Nephrocystin 3-like N-terminal domain-containing protein n=1 Tax=Crepidotus variabilis TaxID=179855 RepID=A0A9P6JRG6_9AGAR|nr:hypothetical protein CPB83DRAFT_850263 [Crepidotus variabilis]
MAPSEPPAQQSINLLEDASNISISGGQLVGGNNNTIVMNTSGMSWLELLLSHCARDALVDSKARQDPPKCAPHTREAIQKEILDWINLLTQSGLVMWLHGSAGAGKSAIAQTIAELLNNEETPSANFFFSRISGSPTRVDGDRLLPTIIYQLCLLLPEYQVMVKRKLKKDPAIFERSRGAQLVALFTKPLQQFSFRRILRELQGGRSTPLVIVIDGLDECRDPQVQCDLLRVIADAAASIRRRPVRFFIASRPETHITRTFDQHPNFQHARLRRIDLDDDPDASMAILTFVRQEFQKIHAEHPLNVHLDPSWPSQDLIDFLVLKSSPQFILASTAMLYVASPKHRPTERLAAVMKVLNMPTSPSTDRPLQRMDMLYTFIFGAIDQDRREVVQAVLGIIHHSSQGEYNLPPPTMKFLEMTLGLPPGEVYLCLEPLVSVLYLPKDPKQPIKSMHASLFDFLINPGRSRDLVLNFACARAGLIGHWFSNDHEMLFSVLKDPKVQAVSFTSAALKAALTIQTNQDSQAINVTRSALYHFFNQVEVDFRRPVKLFQNFKAQRQSSVLSHHASDILHPSTPAIHEMKYALYRSGCRHLDENDHQNLIDMFRTYNQNQHCLFYLLMTYMDTHLLDTNNNWQVNTFKDVAVDLWPMLWSRKNSKTQDLFKELKNAVLEWIESSDLPENSHELKGLWDRDY